ncbi:MAG: preprotein translocase subunit YajC [Rickettsiaceae bacterium H1]|nr:preprotein translocase subunit YajC [Rickettsiaceae bacterium H1]
MKFFAYAFAETSPEIDLGTGTTQNSSLEVGSSLMNFFPLIVIFAIFYFLIIRPQQKKMKNHEKMLSSIKRGDKVSTAGGVIGVVTKVDNTDLILTVEVAENVQIKILKSSVAEIMNRSRNEKKVQNKT